MNAATAQPALIGALQTLQQQFTALPSDHGSLAALDPEQRRDAHALAARLQDCLADLLAQLVADMAADGADMVDAGGLPRSYSAGSET